MEVQKRGRRSWTQEEDDTLLTILEELVVEGHRGENGTFKAGTHEEALKRMLIRVPGINLTVQQIVNKMKRWSLKLSEALDMMNTSGFGWDDVRKCVVVDNPQVLEEYLKKHPKSSNHANKEFKEFERLHVIFGKDRATGHGAETPADVIETQSLQPEWDNMMETQSSQQPESPMSRRQESPISNIGSQSEGSEPKKKRGRMNEVVDKFIEVWETQMSSAARDMHTVAIEMTKMREHMEMSTLVDEVHKLEITEMEEMNVLKKIAENTHYATIFMRMDESRRLIFVKSIMGM
ncbi:hypothetical protein Cni_G16629 [Canna indica]|uniref:Myb/SANT-like domain-containing protein n=1 Tax=Canna indica TaxID=4628 RepID=A0AAQ3KI12_9LILI|nr:hypothetical protein Cni_G16629 [Canna indica]